MFGVPFMSLPRYARNDVRCAPSASPEPKGGIAMIGAFFFASFLLGVKKNEGHVKKRPNRN